MISEGICVCHFNVIPTWCTCILANVSARNWFRLSEIIGHQTKQNYGRAFWEILRRSAYTQHTKAALLISSFIFLFHIFPDAEEIVSITRINSNGGEIVGENAQEAGRRLSDEIKKSLASSLSVRRISSLPVPREAALGSRGNTGGGDNIETNVESAHFTKHYERPLDPNVSAKHTDNGECRNNYSSNYIVCGGIILAIICNELGRLLLSILVMCRMYVFRVLLVHGGWRKAFDSLKEAKTFIEYVSSAFRFPMMAIAWLMVGCLWMISQIFETLLRPAPSKIYERIQWASKEKLLQRWIGKTPEGLWEICEDVRQPTFATHQTQQRKWEWRSRYASVRSYI